MKVLGLAADFHDSSAALVIDGALVASAAEERFTRNKHDASFPRLAVDFCLERGGLKADDLDLVVFYEKPFKKWFRVLDSSLKGWPRSRSEFVESQTDWLGRKLWTKAVIVSRLNVSPAKVIEVDHHYSHLLQAFVGSGFESAAVMTIDAAGEDSAATLSRARWENGRPKVEIISESSLPDSLGLFYSAMTAFLGFKPMNDECTTMALAAFGHPRYADRLRKVVRLDETTGFWRVSEKYLDFDRFMSAPWTPEFMELMGEPRDGSRPLPFSSFENRSVSDEAQHWADVAASVQIVFEECVLHTARKLARLTDERFLCFAGGAALNCVANTRLLHEAGFQRVHVPVEPGDGGASIGAAYAGYFKARNTTAPVTPYSVYMGGEGNDLGELLPKIDVEHTWEYHKHGAKPDRRGWIWERIADREKLAAQIADDLAENRVVGLFQGRFELGPRALGHRSILFRADDVELALKVSREIKDRAEFRPYALAILDEEAPRVLEMGGLSPELSTMRWMQLAVPLKYEALQGLRSGAHVDGTTRPQVVFREEEPLLHGVLEAAKSRLGWGAVINTSMNESGYPLVGSSEEALLMFARTSMDTLVIDDLIVRKALS